MHNNFTKYTTNPKFFTLKKWFSDLLKENNSDHDQILERISHSLVTDKDLEDFGNLITSLYKAGYFKAVDEYKSKLESMGIKTVVTNVNQ